MKHTIKRVAINIGGGFVPGLNSVIAGVVRAAENSGYEVVGIRDGYDGLLHPESYPEGGLLKLDSVLMDNLMASPGCILGTAAHSDPFNIRKVNDDGMVEEVDRSDELLDIIKKEKIDAVISVAGPRALSILWKLSRKGLRTICIPKSIENDVVGTMLSFGFNSALSFLAEMLERVKQAAHSSKSIGVVEVMGEYSGWLALQAGMSVCADCVLIPEVPYDIEKVAEIFNKKAHKGKKHGLIVVAQGARPKGGISTKVSEGEQKLKASLSPGASGNNSSHVIENAGMISKLIASDVQRLTNVETFTILLDQLSKGGVPTVVDRQLGLGYGASAVRALNDDKSGVMVVFDPPNLKYIPISDAINSYRIINDTSGFIELAKSLNIMIGV